jgi:integrase
MGRDKTVKAVLAQQLKAISVQEALQRYVEQKEKLLGNGLCARSVYQYQKYGRKLSEFITRQYGKNWPLTYLTPSVDFDLYAHFKGKQKQAHNYVVKVMQFFKVALGEAQGHGWVDRNVMGAVRFKKERKEVKTLSMEEIEVLAKGELADASLTQVRDVFLFQVYTGLAWTDVHSLASHHIIQVEGIDCIQKERDKSDQQAFVPLFPEALAILDRYANHPICRRKRVLLLVVANATMNRELKRIGKQLGIAQTLRTHLARKSFTLFAEERGFKLDDMATMLGHSHATMTEKHYRVRRREPILKVFKAQHPEGELRRLAS